MGKKINTVFENENLTKEASKRGKKKRSYPIGSFGESFEFVKTIYAIGAGEKVRRLTLFDHMGKSPDSSTSRMLIVNSNKYGLTKGGYQADFIEISLKGLTAVNEEIAPVLSLKAKFELAISDIEIFNFLYSKFAGNKLPSTIVIYDLLKEQYSEDKLDTEDATAIVETFIVNIKYLGLLQTIAGAERIITLEHALEKIPVSTSPTIISHSQNQTVELVQLDSTEKGISTYGSFEGICFYITPIGDEGSEFRMHSDLFLESIIIPAIEQFGLKVIRADQIDRPGTITNQIIEYLFSSKLVIADLSFQNPNVFYELALRHAARLPTVQIIRKSDRIPFDLSQSRTIIIDTTDIYTLVPKLETYKAEIASQVRQVLNNPDSADNPVTNVYPRLKVNLE